MRDEVGWTLGGSLSLLFPCGVVWARRRRRIRTGISVKNQYNLICTGGDIDRAHVCGLSGVRELADMGEYSGLDCLVGIGLCL